MVETPLVAVRGLRKRYGGVVAVDNMNLTVRRGDVHAVVGENGAGKSTLMKALSGVVRPDAGEIEFDGVPAVISSPVVARQYGVGIVYQELSSLPTAIGAGEPVRQPGAIAPGPRLSARYGGTQR